MIFYRGNFFHIATNRNTQPAIKLSPPNGVMAPSHLIPVIANTYKLPENKIIPAVKKWPTSSINRKAWKVKAPPRATIPAHDKNGIPPPFYKSASFRPTGAILNRVRRKRQWLQPAAINKAAVINIVLLIFPFLLFSLVNNLFNRKFYELKTEMGILSFICSEFFFRNNPETTKF